ncbi:MAG: galactose mutarotase, partial [Clostridia bacterium]|nr:galactose mutarotase [Clostridia bacterium]
TMTNKSGASVSVTDFGAITVSIIVPDRNDQMADVCLGFDDVKYYEAKHGSMGDTVGRYGNRIGKGQFTLDGVKYQLEINNGENHLHGGFKGFSSYMWEAVATEGTGIDKVAFHRVSPDGESFYPGTLDVTVTYSWDDDCNLVIRYEATTDKATLCNMTNHTYFNLAGHDHGTIRDQVLLIDADVITPVIDGALIPTGGYMPVVGTPFDLRDGLILGDGLDRIDECEQLAFGMGYDHNFVLRKGEAMGMCAWMMDEESGRVMEVLTDQPGVQLYTASQTDVAGGKGGVHYGQYSGLCLETQHFPDSPNNPQFIGTTVLRPGEKYDTTTIYAFRVEE